MAALTTTRRPCGSSPRLERHYADFDGLNLTWETLEGIAKHNGPVIGPNADKKHDGPLPYALAEVNAQWDLELTPMQAPKHRLPPSPMTWPIRTMTCMTVCAPACSPKTT
jgi:hypothetical protein